MSHVLVLPKFVVWNHHPRWLRRIFKLAGEFLLPRDVEGKIKMQEVAGRIYVNCKARFCCPCCHH
jgi:hypothetical protein